MKERFFFLQIFLTYGKNIQTKSEQNINSANLEKTIICYEFVTIYFAHISKDSQI